jgi:hypothetical protein
MDIKGFTYGYTAKRGDLLSDKAGASLERLLDTGVNWVCLAFAVFQETFSSTEILFDYKRTATDKEITGTILSLKNKGIKVCLKPMINSRDGIWRAHINFPDSDMMGSDFYWDAWFKSYTAFMTHYAEIAADTGAEMLCVGCEMSSTERKEAYWRELIKNIRAVYGGKLVYNTNHGDELKVKWFDAVDFIGTSAYYPVAKKPGAKKDKMVLEWQKISERLEKISKAFNKKLLFMEIGCRSALGCAVMPWDFAHKEFPVSEDEQAFFYDSCMEVFSKKEWFKGVFWWDWSTFIYSSKEEAAEDTGFNIYLKKAEKIVRKWYKKL